MFFSSLRLRPSTIEALDTDMHTHTHTYKHIHVNKHASVAICVYVCMCVCVYAYVTEHPGHVDTSPARELLLSVLCPADARVNPHHTVQYGQPPVTAPSFQPTYQPSASSHRHLLQPMALSLSPFLFSPTRMFSRIQNPGKKVLAALGACNILFMLPWPTSQYILLTQARVTLQQAVENISNLFDGREGLRSFTSSSPLP